MMISEKPTCPKCKAKVNVIRQIVGFRCVFCGKKLLGDEGQQELFI